MGQLEYIIGNSERTEAELVSDLREYVSLADKTQTYGVHMKNAAKSHFTALQNRYLLSVQELGYNLEVYHRQMIYSTYKVLNHGANPGLKCSPRRIYQKQKNPQDFKLSDDFCDWGD